MLRLKKTLNVCLKEFKSIYESPIAYIVMIIFLVFQGWFFVRLFFLRNQAEMREFFTWMPLVFAMILPAITMRLFSEEMSSGSWEILVTLPLDLKEIIVGKFLSVILFVVLLLVPTFFYVVMVGLSGDLDIGPVIGGYLGAIFLGASFGAIGMFASSITRSQIVALVIGLGFCIFFWLVGKMLALLPDFMINFLQHLSTDYHFNNIAKGVLDLRDLIYFASISYVFLHATWMVMSDRNA